MRFFNGKNLLSYCLVILFSVVSSFVIVTFVFAAGNICISGTCSSSLNANDTGISTFRDGTVVLNSSKLAFLRTAESTISEGWGLNIKLGDNEGSYQFRVRNKNLNNLLTVKSIQGGPAGELYVNGTIRATNTKNLISTTYSDNTDNNAWTTVWEAPYDNGKGLKQSNTTYTNLDDNKAVLGFKVEGGATEGGACVFGVTDYFIGAVRYNGFVNKLRTDGTWNGNACHVAGGGSYRDWGNNSGAIGGGPEVILENIKGGDEQNSLVCDGTSSFLYNKSPGVIYIPPGNVLWATQFYESDDDTNHRSYCRIKVLYSQSNAYN